MRIGVASSKMLTAGLILALLGFCLPVSAAGATATLTGSILVSGTQTPLTGARVHVANSDSGEIYSSTAAGSDGTFRIDDLPSAQYQLAVESADGMYLIDSPVKLAPGQARSVMVEVNGQMAPSPAAVNATRAAGVWARMSKVLLVVGSAVVVGVVLESTTDDDPPPASPFSS